MSRKLEKNYQISTDIGDIVPFHVEYIENRANPDGKLKIYQAENKLAEKIGKLEDFEAEPLEFDFQDRIQDRVVKM